MLLWHHLFYNDPEHYDRFVSLYKIGEIPIECQIARFCKVCVAIFLLLSGYGLVKSYFGFLMAKGNNEFSIKNDAKYVFNHLLKLLSDYWFIYILFVPLGLFFGRSFIDIYGTNPLHYIADFFGVSYLLYGYDYTMNLTWWFMSIIIVYYMLFPLLYRVLNYSPELLLGFSVFVLFCPFIPNIREMKTWFCPFVLGMYMARYDSFTTIATRIKTKTKTITVTITAVFAMAFLRMEMGHSAKFDSLFGVAITLLSFLVLSRIPILNKILEQLGKYSGAIFMFHTFIFSYYFKDFIYWFKYPPLIFLVMIVVCYAVAVGLENIKKLIKYDKLFVKITR